jgi:hypothetical protein
MYRAVRGVWQLEVGCLSCLRDWFHYGPGGRACLLQRWRKRGRFRGQCRCPVGGVISLDYAILADVGFKNAIPTAPAITVVLPATLSSGRDGQFAG